MTNMLDASTQLSDLCQRATNLANTNSTRTVEYLSVSKGHQTPGIKELAINFLDVCQTLAPIQAGLNDEQRDDELPSDVTNELIDKIKQTIDDFNALDALLSDLLIYERKKGFSKFTKGWGLMNVDNKVHKLGGAFAKRRDALRMASLAFKWSLGLSELPASTGGAYTSLANALGVASRQKTPSVSQPQTPARDTSLRQPSIKSHHSASQHETTAPAQLPPLPDHRRGAAHESTMSHSPARPSQASPNDLTNPPDVGLSASLTMRQRQQALKSPMPGMALPSPPGHRSFEADKRNTTSTYHTTSDVSGETRLDTISDAGSHTTAEDVMQFEDMLKSYEHEKRNASARTITVPKIQHQNQAPAHHPMRTTSASPNALRHRSPNALPNAKHPTWKAAMVSAVQQKNHNALEELLDSQISEDIIAELDLLKLAVFNADGGSMRLLLLSGADPNRPSADGLTPLLTATDLSELEAASILLKYGADPNLPSGPDHHSPLSLAVATDKLDFLELFLISGHGDINAHLPSGETLFIKSITPTSSLDLVKFMLAHGADPNKKTSRGKTPLLESLFSNRADIASLLLDHGANPNLAGPKHPLWPATHAAESDITYLELLLNHGAKTRLAPGIMELATSVNSIEAVQLLLSHNVDPNVKKDGVYTPLCSAIRDDRGEIVSLLLSRGADPNVPASEYPTFKCVSHNRMHFLSELVAAGADLHSPKGILEVAVHHQNKEALMHLLSQGVNPNDRNNVTIGIHADHAGFTPLTTAIRENNIDFVDTLLSRGASPAVRGQDWPINLAIGNPAILKKIIAKLPKGYHAKGIVEAAVVQNQLESIKLLLAAGFGVEDKTGGVFSPLTSALRERYLDIVKFLLDEAGADVNAPGEHLPIVKALRRCRGPHDTAAIEMLLERGADVNKVYRGWSGIMQAVESGDAEILRLLVEKSQHGVDLERDDGEGKTVLDLVRERSWEEGEAILTRKA